MYIIYIYESRTFSLSGCMSRRDRACTNVLKAVVAYLFKDKEIGFYFYCFGAVPALFICAAYNYTFCSCRRRRHMDNWLAINCISKRPIENFGEHTHTMKRSWIQVSLW